MANRPTILKAACWGGIETFTAKLSSKHKTTVEPVTYYVSIRVIRWKIQVRVIITVWNNCGQLFYNVHDVGLQSRRLTAKMGADTNIHVP